MVKSLQEEHKKNTASNCKNNLKMMLQKLWLLSLFPAEVCY